MPTQHAFRRATIGREDQGVLKPLREFVRRWQATYQEGRDLEWGPTSMTDVETRICSLPS